MFLLGAFAAFFILSIPLLWLVVLVGRSDGGEVSRRLGRIEARLRRLEEERGVAGAPAVEPPPSTLKPAATPQTPAPQQPIAAPPEASPAPAATPARTTSHGTVRPPVGRAHESMEEQIMQRWAVWLGAVALALGGVFLVKYSIERGFFGPTVRVVAGMLLGFILLAVGEVARRRPPAPPLTVLPPDYIPPALAAAGIVTLFASLYAGYALYGLIAPLPAFAMLAGVSAAGVLLALWHGPFLALLGMVGAYAVPLLVATDTPSVPRLLAYVLLVSAGCLWLVRWRDWGWLGWIALAGSGIWTVLALIAANRGDSVWIGTFLFLLAPFVIALSFGTAAPSSPRRVTTWCGAGMIVLLASILAVWAHIDQASLAASWAIAALYVGVAIGRPLLDRLAWMGVALQLLVLAGWTFERHSPVDPLQQYFVLPAPDALVGGYLANAAAVGGIAALAGFFMLWRAPRPDRWALLSAMAPVAVLAIAYWRIEQLAASLPWALVGFVTAAVELGAVEIVGKQRSRSGFTNALAYYALATTAALSLALTLSLRLGWLSVALALQLPALAWLHEHTDARVLRPAAVVLGSIVLVRLLLNPALADYELGTRPILNGLLYTYGVPAAAFAGAARWFRRCRAELAADFLEAGAFALAVALVSLQIRHFITGGQLVVDHYGLLEQALQSDAWLAIGYGLMPMPRQAVGRVRAAAWQVIAMTAAAHLFIVSCVISNPLAAKEWVGTLPILNVLLLAYGVPAIFGALFYQRLRKLEFMLASRVVGIASLALAFLYITLEVRHGFHGALLSGGISDGESYAYSAAWLIFGAALIGSGITFRQPPLRLAGLVVSAIVAVKAFGFDMAALSGLYRAASFLGLGASLVGMAWLYQRIGVGAAPPRDTTPAPY